MRILSSVVNVLLSYPSSSPTHVRHLPSKLKRTSNIDTETSRTSAYNADVLLYKERQLQIHVGLNIVKKCRRRTWVAEQ